jgi:hypothetical protein
MIRVTIGHAAVASAFLLTSSVLASNGASHPQRAVRVEVTPAGAFYRTDDRTDSARTADGVSTAQTSGVIWTYPDSGLAWIPEAVSVGNFGSEVFAEYWLNNERAQYFSAFDTNPPTPLGTDLLATSTDHHCASSERTNTRVGLCEFNQATAGAYALLSKYSSSGTPDWTYTFGIPNLNGGTNVGISRDGQTIVAAVSNFNLGTVEITVFSPASNVPISDTTFNLGAAPNSIRGFDLSADGSTLYFAPGGNPVNAYIWDVASATLVFSTPIGATFDSHAISGDGSVFAFGNFNTMKVWERTGTFYTNTYTRTIAGANFCSTIDISDDSKTIAYGYFFYSPGLTSRVEALDVPTHSVTMSDTITATATPQNLQNEVYDISISADGQRFAVGLWGDGSGPVAEGRLYAKNQNTPLATLNLNGSIFAIAISADGQRFAAGSKSIHANLQGNGGQVDLFGDSTRFTNYCYNGGPASIACPCGNSGTIGHGCNNSSSTGGALLTATGSVSPDTVVLTSSQELGGVLSIFLQGQVTIAGLPFGDGVRCVNQNLKRLYTHNASGGVVSAPVSGDPSITVRSAALGDTIIPGSSRFYQTYYRDPVLGFCPSPMGDSWNVSNAVQINW